MATIKSYTDITQSKTLSKILLLESADMYYRDWKRATKDIRIAHVGTANKNDLPCWSLAALMNIFPKEEGCCTSLSFGYYDVKGNYASSWLCCYEKEGESTDDYIIETETADNPIDACIEMILKLKDRNIL